MVGSPVRGDFAAWFLIAATGVAHCSSLEAIYQFPGTPFGSLPLSSLSADAAGRLYGTTLQGGSGGGVGNGTVFRVTPPMLGAGGWTGEILHYFGDGPEGGPSLAPVTLNAAGQVFGTTAGGGGPLLRGSVFRLDNIEGWPLTVLHDFAATDGGDTQAGVVFGQSGLLYGTTPIIDVGHNQSDGTAFSLSPLGDAVEHAVVRVFGRPGDGISPVGLTPLPSGAFLGATQYGGTEDVGTVFSLRPNVGGKATEKVLYSFGREPDVYGVRAAPIVGRGSVSRSLFGCGAYGGTHLQGGIYRLTPNADSSWTESVIYNFGDHPSDPIPSQCGLVQADISGKLYGTTFGGGIYSGDTFFELDPPAQPGGLWTETVLYNFSYYSKIGSGPVGTPLRVGNAYYGALYSSVKGYGSVYKIRP